MTPMHLLLEAYADLARLGASVLHSRFGGTTKDGSYHYNQEWWCQIELDLDGLKLKVQEDNAPDYDPFDCIIRAHRRIIKLLKTGAPEKLGLLPAPYTPVGDEAEFVEDQPDPIFGKPVSPIDDDIPF